MPEDALPNVLITNDVPDDHLAPLRGIARIVNGPAGGRLMPREEVLALAPELAGIINQHELTVDRELLVASPKLRVVSNVASGFDNFDLAALDEFGVWGTNCPRVFTESAADHTFALLLAVARRVVEADRYCRSGQWGRDGFQPGVWDGVLLSGKTIGIVGFGGIGRAVARRADAFRMQVLFHDATETGDPRQRTLRVLLEQSDVVSLHVPLSSTTRHLLNREGLAAMRVGAIVLNLARGGVLDDAALADALGSGRLLGAGLDVVEHEPSLHPGLLAHPRVVLSPHIGGGTTESRRHARLMCAENVAAVLTGDAPPHPVNRLHQVREGAS